MFTTSQVCAAPVKVSLPRVKKGQGAGHRGQFRQRQRLHRRAGLARRQGDDGHRRARLLRLPVGGRVGRLHRPHRRHAADGQCEAGHSSAAGLSTPRPKTPHHAAEAIMTSDTRPKEIAVEFKLGGTNGPHRRHLQGRGHDPARHEPRQAGGRPPAHGVARHDALFSHHGCRH